MTDDLKELAHLLVRKAMEGGGLMQVALFALSRAKELGIDEVLAKLEGLEEPLRTARAHVTTPTAAEALDKALLILTAIKMRPS